MMPHIGVKGRVDSGECVVFGLSQNELRRARDLLNIWGHKVGQDGHQVAQSPLQVVQVLATHLGYSVVATAPAPHSTVVYTMHRSFY